MAACAVKRPYPADPVVADVVFEGVDGEHEQALRQGLATAESGRLLGIWDGVTYDYETFDDSVLQADLERVQRYYQKRGFYEARVHAARVVRVDEHHVRVHIKVVPGEPMLTRGIDLRGVESIDIESAALALQAVRLEVGEPFDEDDFERSEEDIANLLADRGYAFAKVEGEAHVDLSARQAFARFHVVPGPKARYGPIRVSGLEEIDESAVFSALKLRKGAPYSRADLKSAQQALFALGVFSQVVIDQDLGQPETAEVPVTVRVSEASLRSLDLGLGASMDVLRTAAYGRGGWEHRNFLGGLRRLSLRERPGVTLFPTRIDLLRAPTKPLFENSAEAELRQPAFLEGRTTGWIKTAYNVYPLLYPLPENVDPDQETIIGYHEVATGTGLDRTFAAPHVPVSLSYNWQANIPLGYQIHDHQAFEELENVYVSFPELNVALDLRDDPVSPLQGIYARSSVQLANPFLFGTVSDLRVEPELRTFYPLMRRHDVVLATRFKVGFVFPRNYGDSFDPDSDLSRQLFDNPEDLDPAVINDQQKILFRAFYSGGPTSNRGYPFRLIGPQGPIGFLLPTGQDCTGEPGVQLPSACIRPLGGFSLWEASMEIRFPIVEPVYGTVFVDASNVSNEVASVDLSRPHLAVGPGLRWMTPVGPIRLDVGYRVPGWQIRKRRPNDETYFPDIALTEEFKRRPPFAYHIAIGEAF